MNTEIIFQDQLERAADFLRKGDPVAFPTETVYGLGAPIFDVAAIEKVFSVKGRPSDNPLIAHISALEQVSLIATEIPKEFYQLSDHFFPGPLTVILHKNQSVPSIVSGGLNTIALRMPSHPIAKKLIAMLGEPLVAPSANLSGRPSSTSVEHVLEDFDRKIAAVVDGGNCEIGIESTVVSLISPDRPIVLRPGIVTKDQLEEVLKKKVEVFSKNILEGDKISSPGMKYRHYAPEAPVKLFTSLDELVSYCHSLPLERRMLLSHKPIPELDRHTDHFYLSRDTLYGSLRDSDRNKYSEILVFCDEEIVNESALMNRLIRASH